MRPTRTLAPVLAVAVAAAVGLAACGGSDEEPAGGGAGSAAPATVTIENFTFEPAALEVPAGTRITVRNTDDAAHTLTADDDSFDTGDVDAGASASVVVEGSGAVPYHCDIHDYMTGVIRIVGP